MKIGRNDPCPCGSGRKFKHCHLGADDRERLAERDPQHTLDGDLVEVIAGFMLERFPDDAEEVLEALATYPGMEVTFAMSWLAYVDHFDGRPSFEHFLDYCQPKLTARDVDWLVLQRTTHLSVWECTAVEPGRTITLRDALTGQTRTVFEATASRSLVPHVYVLARVVDASPHPLLCGNHSIPLPPNNALQVIESARKALRRKRDVPPERLRDSRIAWRLLQAWCDEITALRTPPRLTNTDGDPFLLTTDRFTFAQADRPQVLAVLSALEGAERHDDHINYVREREDQKGLDVTVIGSVNVSESSLVAETNSIARADALRSRIEEACGTLLRRGARTHIDPTSSAHERPARPAAEESPELAAIALQYKTEHYRRWMDSPLPALEGRSPREVARTRSGREKVRILLDGIELTESRFPHDQRIDVDVLRRDLGIL